MGKGQSKTKRAEKAEKEQGKSEIKVEPKKKKFVFSTKKKENRKLEVTKRKESIKKIKKSSVTSERPTEQDYEASVQLKIQRLLQTDCPKFLLNLMLLSVQFYSNYER